MLRVALILMLPGVLLMTGCAATMPAGGSVMPGAIFNSSTSPGAVAANDLYQANPDSFTVKGYVEGSSEAINVFGLFSFGNGGYRAAIDDATRRASADALINCVADVKTTSFLFVFSKSTTVVRGLAIQRK